MKYISCYVSKFGWFGSDCHSPHPVWILTAEQSVLEEAMGVHQDQQVGTVAHKLL